MKPNQIHLSTVVDSAFALAMMAAVFYFFGLANLHGDASGLGIPQAFFKRDIWDTVAYGVEGVLISMVMLPVTFYGHSGIRWAVIIVIVVGLSLIFLSYFLLSRWKYRLYLVGFLVINTLYAHIFVNSAFDVQDRVIEAFRCLRGQGCKAARIPNRVVFQEKEGALSERVGIMISMNRDFLIMVTLEGLFIVPVSSIRTLQTDKNYQAEVK